MHPFIKLAFTPKSETEMGLAAQDFADKMLERRSVREFSEKTVNKGVIENILKVANSAPSGANKQPWTFCVVHSNEIKKRIREEAEKEEYLSYHGRMSAEWLADLAPLGTNWEKPFLEAAPWLIVVFKKVYDVDDEGSRTKNYYVSESVGIACGFLIAAIHNAGLVTLTHTPSPMNFLQSILQRPENEKPYLLLPIGYPNEEAKVPDIQKKGIEETVLWF